MNIAVTDSNGEISIFKLRELFFVEESIKRTSSDDTHQLILKFKTRCDGITIKHVKKKWWML